MPQLILKVWASTGINPLVNNCRRPHTSNYWVSTNSFGLASYELNPKRGILANRDYFAPWTQRIGLLKISEDCFPEKSTLNESLSLQFSEHIYQSFGTSLNRKALWALWFSLPLALRIWRTQWCAGQKHWKYYRPAIRKKIVHRELG